MCPFSTFDHNGTLNDYYIMGCLILTRRHSIDGYPNTTPFVRGISFFCVYICHTPRRIPTTSILHMAIPITCITGCYFYIFLFTQRSRCCSSFLYCSLGTFCLGCSVTGLRGAVFLSKSLSKTGMDVVVDIVPAFVFSCYF